MAKITSKKKKEAIFAMVKSGDFKTNSKGVVQLNSGKGGEESDAPSEDNDVERFEEFVGVQEMNVGELDDEPNFEDNPFGFLGINSGEFGEIQSQADPQGESTETGVSLTNVSSGGNKQVTFEASPDGKRLTLDWWKVYLDSCASYHTFFVKEFLKNIQEGKGTMNGNCNAGETRITKRGYFEKMTVWLNENGIANLISIPKLEADGYTVWTDTKREWIVSTPTWKLSLSREIRRCA